MSQWENRVENHKIHTTLSNYESKISEVEQKGISDANGVEAFERINKIIRLLKNYLTQDPVLIPISALNNLNNHLQASFNELNSFISNQNVAHLNNSNANLDNLLVTLPQINFESSFSLNDFTETMVSFRRSAGQYMHYLEDEYQKIKTEFDGIKKEFTSAKDQLTSQVTRVDNLINNFQTQFTEAESKRSETFNNSEIRRTEKFDSEVDSEKEKISKIIESSEEQTDSELEKFKKDSVKSIHEVAKKTDDLVNDLQLDKEEAERLVNIIANVGMAAVPVNKNGTKIYLY